jgi:hypothetical protein
MILYLKTIIGGLMKIFLTVVMLIILGISLSFGLDENAIAMQDQALDRAMIAFGLAKGLNAIISLIQGTEISLAPAGLGLSFSVGEVLDPFNDMVERFSWVMLFSSVSLGIQKLLLMLSSKLFLQVAMGASIVATLMFLWIKKLEKYNLILVSLKLFVLLVFLRFGAIFFVYTSDILYTSVLETEYEKATKIVSQTKTKLEELNTQNKEIVVAQQDQGFIEKFYSAKKHFIESLNISERLESLEAEINEASRNIVNLITLFLVQSVLMPLLFLWLFIVSIKVVLKVDLDVKKLMYN